MVGCFHFVHHPSIMDPKKDLSFDNPPHCQSCKSFALSHSFVWKILHFFGNYLYIYIYIYMYLEIRVALALVLQYNYTQLLVVLFLVLRSASHLYNVYLHRRPCSLSAFSEFGPRRVTKYQLTFYFGVSCIWAIYNDLGPVHPKWRFRKGIPPKMVSNHGSRHCFTPNLSGGRFPPRRGELLRVDEGDSC